MNQKAVFIAYNNALDEQVRDILSSMAIRGNTGWESINGTGSVTGEPHMGNHTWPTQNNAMLVIVNEEKVARLLDKLRALDESVPKQGLRAFVWHVEQAI